MVVASSRAFLLGCIVLGFICAMPLQWLACRLRSPLRHWLPRWFHKAVCAAMGMRVATVGQAARDRPRMVVANHVSWLDIPALGSSMPLSFLAKKEVGEWPVIGAFARLQNCLFVDRTRKRALPEVNRSMAASLGSGNALVLFPEATTGDGNRLLRFHAPHFAAAIVTSRTSGSCWLQPVAVQYRRRNGLPFDRLTRPGIAWYGDMTFLPHLWSILRDGPIDCLLIHGEPLAVAPDSHRKQLASACRVALRGLLADDHAATP